jgi:large repetitive protein
MVGRRYGRKLIGRLIGVSVIALATMLVVPLASASAATPTIAIASPSEGSAIANSTPTIAGTTDYEGASVVVDVYAAGEPLIPVQTLPSGAGGGAWSVVASFLSDGSYTAVAEQTNAETSERGSAQVAFTVDTTKPSVSLNAPTTPTNDSTPTFTGSGGTAPGDASTVIVTVYSGSSTSGGVVASGTPSLSGSTWSYTPEALADGTYTVQATQSDEAGNVGESTASTFTVDTTAPSVSLNAIATLTNNPTPTFTGTGGTASGDATTVTVTIYSGFSTSGSVVTSGTPSLGGNGWSWTVAAGHLKDASTYTVQVSQRDQAGNVGKSNAATFKVDTSPPILTITSPKSGETLKSSRPTFSGTTNNGTGEPLGVTIEISNTETASAQTFETSRNGSSWTTGNSGPRLANGTYMVRVREADAAGNVGESPALTFVVESPAPTVTLDALAEYMNDKTPSFAGSADMTEAKPEVTVKIWHGTSASGVLAGMTTVSESAGAWSAVASGALTDGVYTAQAEQPGEDGNPAGVSGTREFTVDTVAPVLSLAGPSQSTGLETLSGEAGNVQADRQAITVELFAGSAVGEPGQAFEALTINRSGSSWSATFASLPVGEYTAIARQSDEAGNVGASDTSSFTVTASPTTPPVTPPTPSPPSASFTWVPATPVVGQSVSLVSSSTDPSSAISSFAWDVAGNGQFAAGGPAMTTSFATAGTHSVSLRVTDANGLSSTATETVKVAAVAPKLMQPFPIVRIAGSETSYGVKVRLLTVQAPLGAKVSIACVGGGCKTKAESRVAKASSKSTSRAGAVTLAFARFERPLKAGASLQIRVTQAGEIGKFTSFAIRRKRLPVRTDACLQPASSKPSGCPNS